jgi:phage/plasmid-associated DNA primase
MSKDIRTLRVLIREYAEKWYKRGFNVIPLRYINGKLTPMIEWHEFVKRRQTEEEFKSIKWEQADGLAIVIPEYPINGYYVGVVDQDTHEGHPNRVTPEAEEIGKKVMTKMPITYFERTPHKGQHHIYRSKKPVSYENFLDEAGLELLGSGRILIVYPTPGYEKMNDNPFTIVEDLNQTFYNALKSMGIDTYESKEQSIETEVKDRARIEYSEELLNKILEVLRPRIEENKTGYITIHCPFHPPDNHPSFVIYKNSYIAVDFHEMIGINKWKTYTLKELAKKLGIEYEEPRTQYRELKESQITTEDWTMWKKLDDINLQEEILNEWSREQKIGVLYDEFLEWLKREGPDKEWEDMPTTEKIIHLYSFLQEKEIIIPFEVFRPPKGDTFFLSYGYNNILLDFDEKIENVLNKLFAGLISYITRSELAKLLKSKAIVIQNERLNPISKLRLADGILDLKTLKYEKIENVADSYYFTYYAPVYTTQPLQIHLQNIIEQIKDGSYPIELNPVYKYFRNRFDDENWNYLTDALGTILSPYRFRLLVFLYGPHKSGKSTLLQLIYKTLKPLVANTRLETITDYAFGLQTLIDKQILLSRERGQTVLRKLDLLNSLFGETDLMDVPIKYKDAKTLISLKLGIIAMNDLPIIKEFGGETMIAFLDRLSIIRTLEPTEIIPHLEEQITPEDVFEFLLWCRVQLEKRNWEIRKKDIEIMLNLFREETNPVYQFLKSDYIMPNTEGRVKGKDLYDIYVKWSVEKGIAPVGLQDFYTFIAHKHEKYIREKTVWFKGLSITKTNQTQTY